jgi:hypothetical protein
VISRALSRLLIVSCVLTLMALALMVWSLFDPRPIPVVATMSLGQLLGTLSLGSFGYVVIADLRAQLRRRRAESMAPSKAP